MSPRDFQTIKIDEDAYIRTDGFLFFLHEGPSQQGCYNVAHGLSILMHRRLHDKSYPDLQAYFREARSIEKMIRGDESIANAIHAELRVEALEEAILDANAAVSAKEMLDLSDYLALDNNYPLSAKVIINVLAKAEEL